VPSLISHRIGAATGGVKGRIGAYLALTKPRIIELLLVTTIPAMVVAADGLPQAGVALATVVGGALAAGSANAFNSYIDRDIDAVMARTQRRPMARHTISERNAVIFGFVLGILSILIMLAWTNVLAAVLTFGAIAFYVVIYTMILKRRTASNIVWGGAAGCFPVLIGWAAITDAISLTAILMFLIVFFWTPPHYWPLAIRYREDYEAAGVPMLPVVASMRTVGNRIVAYSLVMVAVSLALIMTGDLGTLYAVTAVLTGAAFLGEAIALRVRVARGADPRAMRLFHGSISYLAILFLSMVVDVLI
jgi:protoheme IX farnesyltransferase